MLEHVLILWGEVTGLSSVGVNVKRVNVSFAFLVCFLCLPLLYESNCILDTSYSKQRILSSALISV